MTAISADPPQATSADEAQPQVRRPLRERFRPAVAVQAVRNNKAMSVLVLIGVLLRVGVAVAYRPALALFGDSFAYVVNARHLVPGRVHPLGYAVVLRIFDTTGSLAAVTIFQHVLGVALGVGTYVLLKRLGVRSWLAAAAAAPALLDAYQADIEQFILAEVTFEVLLLAGLAALLLAGHRWLAAGAGGLLLALATTTRVVGLFVLVLAAAWLALRRVGWRPLLAFGLAGVIPLLGYASWYDAANGEFALGGNGNRFLWGKVAPISNCAADHVPRRLHWLCLPQKMGHRPTTEFLDWNPASPFLTHPGSMADRSRAAGEVAHRVIVHQPVAYARLVARDMAHYFRWTRTSDYIDWYVQTWWFLDPLAPSSWHSGIIDGNPAQIRSAPVPAVTQPAHQPASVLRGYQKWVFVPGPVLALLALLGIAGAIWGRRHSPVKVWAAGPLLAAAGFVLLLQPAATVPLDYRYVLPAMLLFVPAGALGLEALMPRLRGDKVA